MKKILYILGIWGNGGIEKVISTYCERLDKTEYEISILPIEMRESVFTEKVNQLGIHMIIPSQKVKGNFICKYRIRQEIILDVVRNTQYDIIHYHNSNAVSYIYINAIKRCCPKTKVILHSHGDDAEAPFVKMKRLFNAVIRKIYQNIPDFYAACSENAGKWLFSEAAYNSQRYKTFHNAFDTKIYCINETSRNEIRMTLNIESKYLLGTVGRFCYQKNPEFILEVIRRLYDAGMDFSFLWVGDGNERESIMCKVKGEAFAEKIIFMRFSDDIPGIMSAMDAFLLPSKYEGLGLVLIEALCAGLPCYASDKIPRATKLTDKIKYLSIESPVEWANVILKDVDNGYIVRDNADNFLASRKYPETEILQSVFNLDVLMMDLNDVYRKLLK